MSLVFDNSAKYLSNAAPIDYNSVYTFVTRLRFDALTTFDTVIVISDGTADNRDLLFLNGVDSTKISVRVTVAAGQTTVTGTTTLAAGVIYDMALVRHSTTDLTLYINNVLEVINTRNVAARVAATDMRIARDQSSTNDAKITMGRHLLWTTNLRSNILFNQQGYVTPLQRAALFGFYPVFPGAFHAKDFSGLNNHWTENGTISDTAPLGTMPYMPSALPFFESDVFPLQPNSIDLFDPTQLRM